MERHDYYVYVYIDPRNFEEFYYGKGSGARKMEHLKDAGDSEKARRIRAIKAAGGDGWFPPFGDITPETVAEARALGLKLGAWTVDDPKDMRRLIDRGLDALCTDRPDVLADILHSV